MTDRQYGGLELHQFFLPGVRQALLVSLGDGYFCITAVLRAVLRNTSAVGRGYRLLACCAGTGRVVLVLVLQELAGWD
jgi:hypothetical protein